MTGVVKRITGQAKWCAVFVSAFIFVVMSVCAHGNEITRMSGVEPLHSLKKFYSISNFKIGGEYEIGNEAAYEFGGKGGATLESLG